MASSVWSALEGQATNMSSVAGTLSSADPASMLNNQLASALSTMGDAQYWEESISPTQIRTELAAADPSNVSHATSILRGMKWLLASISKGRDVSDFFALVVKLVGAAHLEARKMVYMYLVQYADHSPETRELSLLSINAFQRGLADHEQLIRALALRVLTSIRIPDILQIQILGVQKCAADTSPYVRKCAANALAKLAPRCEAQQRQLLLEIVKNLLDTDVSTMVLSSAVTALNELAPDRLELLHSSFRKICHLLTDMDEWGQVIVIDVLSRYCRQFFAEPVAHRNGTAERIDAERRVRRTVTGIAHEQRVPVSTESTKDALQAAADGVTLPPRSDAPRKVKRRVVKKGFYSDESDESTEEEVYADSLAGPVLPISSALRQRNILGVPGQADTSQPATTAASLNTEDAQLAPDHRLLLHSAMPLLKSRNAGVVLAVCSLQYYCGVASVPVRASMGKALVRIHRDQREIQYVVLASIQTLVKQCPSAFGPFLNDFFVKALDPPFVRLRKLDILVSLALEPAAIQAVLGELRNYIRHADKVFACAAIGAVGQIVELARLVYDRHGTESGNVVKERAEANTIALNCLHGLLTLTQSCDNAVLVGEGVVVMHRIWQMLVSDGNEPGDLLQVQDAHHVQDRVVRQVLLLLTNTLSKRMQEQEETENDNDEDDMEREETKLEQLAVELPAAATAAAIWLIGESLTPLSTSRRGKQLDDSSRSTIRLEVIRLLVRCFPELEAVEKEQAIHLASKLMVSKAAGATAMAGEGPLCEHVLAMGRVDINPDVRDRARYESGVLRVAIGLQYDTDSMENMPSLPKKLSLEDTKRILLQIKPASSSLPLETSANSQSEEGGNFRFGTLSSLVGHRARSAYVPLPPWAEKDSPSSLREPPSDKKNKSADNGGAPSIGPSNGGQKQGSFYDSSMSSSSEDESSSSGSSSDESDGDSTSESSSSESSTSTDSVSSNDQRDGLLVPVESQRQPMMPSANTNGSSASKQSNVQVEDASDDSSSSGSSSSSSESDVESSDDSSRAAPRASGVGSLIAMGAPAAATSASLHSANGSTSSAADDMKGLVLAPVAMDATDEPTDPNVERDSSAWMSLVKPEHAGGLSVQARYLRGLTKSREAQLMGLTAGKATLVCLQLRFENEKKDGGTVRRLRVLQRSSSSSSSAIAPRKVVVPPEIAVLKAGERADCMLGIDFNSASDRDGALQAKLDIKTGTGSIPVEIKPLLGDLLLPCKRTVAEFDAAISKLQGFQRVESKFSIDATSREILPQHLVSMSSLTPVGKLSWKDDSLRLAGTLPAAGDPLYVLATCSESGSGKLAVCCDHALAVNSVMNLMKRAVSKVSSSSA